MTIIHELRQAFIANELEHQAHFAACRDLECDSAYERSFALRKAIKAFPATCLRDSLDKLDTLVDVARADEGVVDAEELAKVIEELRERMADSAT